MIGRPRHLSDSRLLDICLHVDGTADDEGHVDACERCGARRADLVRLLDELTEAAAHDADLVFTPKQLAKQHARILQRIDQEGRPGRVITFPALPSRATWTPRHRPAMRWLAAAAAAGLLIGLLAGHFAHQLPARTLSSRVGPARPGIGPTLAAATAAVSDEEFLGQLESALQSPSTAVLRPLDDLTPTAWDGQ